MFQHNDVVSHEYLAGNYIKSLATRCALSVEPAELSLLRGTDLLRYSSD